MSTIDGLLVGIICTASFVASTFFLKFWRTTRDQLFLAFAIAFALEGATRVFTLFTSAPYDGVPAIYLARLLAYLVILAAIFRKNRKSPK